MGGKKKEITTINRDTIKENISEAGKNILSVIVENNMIYIADSELNDLVRQYTEKKIKELEEEFQKIGTCAQ